MKVLALANYRGEDRVLPDLKRLVEGEKVDFIVFAGGIVKGPERVKAFEDAEKDRRPVCPTQFAPPGNSIPNPIIPNLDGIAARGVAAPHSSSVSIEQRFLPEFFSLNKRSPRLKPFAAKRG